MIKPTIGRVVWFRPSEAFIDYRYKGGSPFVTIDTDDPCAAIVVKVWNDRMVNLSVFDHEGHQHAVTSCHLRQEGDDESLTRGLSYCEWMPYQKGQAAKTEALETKIGEVPIGVGTASPGA